MSKPSSPRSPRSPKDAKSGGEKQTLDLGELMQRLDGAVAKTIEDYSDLFVTNFKEQRSVLEDCRDYIDKLGWENATMAEKFRRRDEEAVSYYAETKKPDWGTRGERRPRGGPARPRGFGPTGRQRGRGGEGSGTGPWLRQSGQGGPGQGL